MDITDEQYEQLRSYYTMMVDKCEQCAGAGITKTGKTCKCQIWYAWVRALVCAGIPAHYWTFSLMALTIDADLQKRIGEYIDRFSSDLFDRTGMFLCGDSGVGKTTIACVLGRSALVRGLSVTVTTAARINLVANAVKCGEADANAIDSLLSYDVVVLDELDKIVFTESAKVNLLMALKAHIMQRRFIITTNYDESEITEQFGSAMMSLLKRHTIIMPIVGTDKSDAVQSKLQRKRVSALPIIEAEAVAYCECVLAKKAAMYDEVL